MHRTMANFDERSILRQRWLKYVEVTFDTLQSPEQISAVVDGCIGALTDEEVTQCVEHNINCVD